MEKRVCHSIRVEKAITEAQNWKGFQKDIQLCSMEFPLQNFEAMLTWSLLKFSNHRIPVFTFPQEVRFHQTPTMGIFFPHIKPKSSPINPPFRMPTQSVLADMPNPSLTGLSLLGIKEMNVCPRSYFLEDNTQISTSPIPPAIIHII